MEIRSGAKRILQYLKDRVIQHGDLSAQFAIDYAELAKELSLDSSGYCHVCCQYLQEKSYIAFIRREGDIRIVALKAAGIDFLETTT